MDPDTTTSIDRSWFRLPGRTYVSSAAMRWMFLLAAAFVFVVVAAIFYVLAASTFGVHIHIGDPDTPYHLWIDQEGFFESVSFKEFFTATEWRTAGTVDRVEGGRAGVFGILPLISGTLLVASGAALIGLPLGLATAVYLSEYASPRVRGILKPSLELLAGIPSIVFGFVALTVISPIVMAATAEGTLLGGVFGHAQIFNAASAMIVVGIMVLPIVSSISEDALRSVPRHLKEASYGLGATKWETTRKVVLPSAVSGITASFVLAVTRAIGETMAVTLAAGTQARLTANPVEAVQTMTAFIAQKSTGDLPQQGPVYLSLFAVGFTLFIMTLIMNFLAQRFVRRFREVET